MRSALAVLAALSILAAAGASALAAPRPAEPLASSPRTADGEDALARARTDLARLQSLAAAPDAPPTAEAMRRLQARLVVLLAAGRTDTPPAADRSGPAEAEAEAALAALVQAAPPVPLATVDAARDRRDGIADQREGLSRTLRGLESRLEALVTARRRAEEAQRLAEERLQRARAGDDVAQRRAEADLAALEVRVAAQEVLRADRDRAWARDRLAAVQARLVRFDEAIERVRPLQRLDDEAIAAVAASAATQQQRLAMQRQRLQQRLQAVQAATGADEDTGAQQEAATLDSQIATLAELDQVEAGRVDVWRQRRALLDAVADAASRASAQAAARRSVEQIGQRLQGTGERLAAARAALRTQRLQAEAAAVDPQDARRRAPVLAAMQADVEALEELDGTLRRLQALVQRSLDDLAVVAGADRPPWHERAWTWLRATALAVWRHELFSVSETTSVDGRPVTLDYGVTVGKAVAVALLFVVGWWIARRLSRAAIALLVRRAGLSVALGRVLDRWFMAILGLVVLLVVLKLARIPLTAFAFLGGALAIGVGFGTQNIIKNLISGVIILFERNVRVGDVITVDGVSGTVTSVDLRATTVRGFDGIAAIVPNSQLLEGRVSNWSLGSPVVRRALTVGLAYGDDARAAADLIRACAVADTAVLPEPAPEVLLDDFGADAQVLRLQYWFRLGGARAGPTVDSDLRHAIGAALARGGYTIAFPQRDVRLRWHGPLPPVQADAA